MIRSAPAAGAGASPVRLTIRVLDAVWRRRLPAVERLARRAARAALAGAAPVRRARPGELCLVLADDALLQRLNRTYRGIDKPTNVLSFAGEPRAPRGGMGDYGDVVVARQTLLGEARAQGKRPADHLTHLVVHGVLHLLGYDHVAKAEADRMERLEVAILARLGVADPYQMPRRRPARGLRRR